MSYSLPEPTKIELHKAARNCLATDSAKSKAPGIHDDYNNAKTKCRELAWELTTYDKTYKKTLKNKGLENLISSTYLEHHCMEIYCDNKASYIENEIMLKKFTKPS